MDIICGLQAAHSLMTRSRFGCPWHAAGILVILSAYGATDRLLAQTPPEVTFAVSSIKKPKQPPTLLRTPAIACEASAYGMGVQFPLHECTTEQSIHLNDDRRIPFTDIYEAGFIFRKVPAAETRLLDCKGKLYVIDVSIVRASGDTVSGFMWMPTSCSKPYRYAYSLIDYADFRPDRPPDHKPVKLPLDDLRLSRIPKP